MWRVGMKFVSIIGGIVLVCSMGVAYAGPQEQELIKTLRSDAPAAEKAIACKRLAIYGGNEAVPALAPLLADEQLSSWARIALEAIPGPAADEALRQAAEKVKGRLLIAVINSMGVRGDAKAVGLLAAKLKDSDAGVASASAVALGRIGDEAAAKVLKEALAGSTPQVRSAVADGIVRCGEKLLAAGKNDDAAALYDLVRKADVPKQRIREATRGVILARKAAGVPLLVELLRSADKEMFRLGLTVAREVPDQAITEVLAAELANASPERQSLLLTAIADRGGDAARKTVLNVAKSGTDSVKIAAAEVLKELGDVSCVPVLLDLAVSENAAVAAAAVEALAGMSGDQIGADIVARLPKAEGKVRLVLLQLAGDRLLVAAVPEAIKAASASDAQVRVRALATLGSIVEFKDLAVLVDRVVNAPTSADEAKAAQNALKAACQRMPDIDACAKLLVAAIKTAKPAAQVQLLETLAALGGPTALEAVAAAAGSSDKDMQDAATRVLGEWMSLEAAPVLEKLASSMTDEKYQVRAARAYIRLLRQFPMPDDQRIAMSCTAMRIAKRDAEKTLILGSLGRHPCLEGWLLASMAAKNGSLKADADKASAAIVQKIGNVPPQVKAMVDQLGADFMKIEILKAQFGAGEKVKDVTETVRKSCHGLPVLTLSNKAYNAAFGGDPAPSTLKQLRIEYRINGKAGNVTLGEDAPVVLPIP